MDLAQFKKLNPLTHRYLAVVSGVSAEEGFRRWLLYVDRMLAGRHYVTVHIAATEYNGPRTRTEIHMNRSRTVDEVIEDLEAKARRWCDSVRPGKKRRRPVRVAA